MFNSHFHSSLFTDILTSLINNRLADEYAFYCPAVSTTVWHYFDRDPLMGESKEKIAIFGQ